MMLRSSLRVDDAGGGDPFRSTSRSESPPTSPRADAPVDAAGYTANLLELISFLNTTPGLKMFKSAYRENMLYKVARYRELMDTAEEDVEHERARVELKRPDLKRVSRVTDDSDNWSIFETIGKGYMEAKDRASAFGAVRERAEGRLRNHMAFEEVRAKDDAFKLRDDLVEALRTLSNFSSQSHIVATVVDIVGAFLKNPKLIRTKFMNFMMVGAAGTGKTTIASAIARAFARAGMFVDDKVVDAGRAEFVGEFEGQTVARTRNFLVSNLDRGVVFIDEAYALTQWNEGKPEGYGSEAVTAMVEFMTRYKGLYCIITAGYEREMTRYFLPTNQGLTRRFPYRFVLKDLSADDLLYVFRRTLLTEQGIEVPSGRSPELDSDAYFTDEAWDYLRALLETCTDGETAYDDEEYDRATRLTYRRVRRFLPRYPLLYRLFENQAGSMTNLAEEAVTVLMRTVTYKDAVTVVQRSKGIARATIRTQPKSVMRDIIVQRILNSALSEASDYLDELDDAEQQQLLQ